MSVHTLLLRKKEAAIMKGGLIISGSGALIYLTSHKEFIDDALIEKFKSKGIAKFIAYEVPVDELKNKYKGHFDIVMRDLRETNDLRILDYDGSRAFSMFSLKSLGEPIIYE
jgi:hypothetical protein